MQKEKVVYDQIDVRNSYRAGFWIGVTSSFILATVLLALVGLYLH